MNVISALSFLIDAFIGIYILLIMLRVLLYYFGAGIRDAISHFIWQVTDPVLKPLYNFIPGWRRVDFAAILLMLVLEIIKWIILLLLTGSPLNVIGILLQAITGLLSLMLNIFFFAILIRVIFSWIEVILERPMYDNPLHRLLYVLTEPLLAPVRRMLPDTPIDISPLIVSILLVAGIILLG